MPVITVKVRQGRTPEQKHALMTAIRDALFEAFQKKDSLYVWLEEYDAGRCLLPGDEENCIIVQAFCFAGRCQCKKDAFYRLAAEKLEAAGEKTHNLVMVLSDPPLGDWGIAGKSAVDLLGGR